MIQTVTQNNALSQNKVECTVHTPMAEAAHSAVSWRKLGRIVALSPDVSWPCLRLAPAVSWSCHGVWAPCHRAPATSCVARRAAPCHSLSGLIAGTSLLCRCAHARAEAPCRSIWACCVIALPSRHREPCRSNPAPCRTAQAAMSSVVSRAVSRPKSCLSDTIQHLYRDSPASQAVRMRALLYALAHGQPCRGLCWPCCGAVSQGLLAMSWPPCCTPRRPVSRYNALYHDQGWEMGSSPSSLLHILFFFFHLIFFSFVPPTRRP